MDKQIMALVVGSIIGLSLLTIVVVTGVPFTGEDPAEDDERIEVSGEAVQPNASVDDELAADVDSIFLGVIDNKPVNPGVISGEGVYDQNCIPVDPDNKPVSVVTCDAGIDTDEYGVLNFYYKHDMSQNPCITPGNDVVLDIQTDDGDATAYVSY